MDQMVRQLQYLARKTGHFGGPSERDRIAVDQWLMWQMGGLGPMAGQAHHFLKYAPHMDPPQDIPYAKDRYRAETSRLYGVLDRQLASLPAMNLLPGIFIPSRICRSGAGRPYGKASSKPSTTSYTWPVGWIL